MSLTAQESIDDHLIVTLETETSLKPVYLFNFKTDESSFPSSYHHQLQAVLTFDLSHNGSTYVAKPIASMEKNNLENPFKEMGSVNDWRNASIPYVVKVQIQNKALNALILNIDKLTVTTTETFTLTGSINQDRRFIHRLADQIHQALFGTDGIAATKILYTTQTKHSADSSKWICEVWESDYDGENARQITKENSTCHSPVYIPPKPGFTSGGFLYVSYQSGQSKICLCPLNKNKGQRLLSLSGNQFMPAVSKQRDKIAFISDVTGNPDLFLQQFSSESGPIGKPRQIFSAAKATQGSPTFSPDGKQIAFVSNKDGSAKIYVLTIPEPGTALRSIKANLISKQNRENSAPAWSPDGTKIAYCAKGSGNRQIWVYDLTTQKEKQVTFGSENKENPTWAPNSALIVYNTADKPSCELYIVHLDHPQPTQISSGRDEKRFPCWEPMLISNRSR